MVAKKEAYYSALMGGNKFEKAGIKLGARAHANLMGRAGRARGMHVRCPEVFPGLRTRVADRKAFRISGRADPGRPSAVM